MTGTIVRGAAVALIMGLATVLPARSEVISLKANMNGRSEIPPNTATGTGSVAITYDTADKRLSWKGTVTGLSGAATAAHFHGPAEPGKNAGVQISIPNPGPSFEGSAVLTQAQANDLLGGRMYVNIHTAAHPGGELRGQVEK